MSGKRQPIVCGHALGERSEDRFYGQFGPLTIALCRERRMPFDGLGSVAMLNTWCGTVEFGIGLFGDAGKSRFVVAHVEHIASLDDAESKLNSAAAASFAELGRCIGWATKP